MTAWVKNWFYHTTPVSEGLHSSSGVIDVIPSPDVNLNAGGGGGATVVVEGADNTREYTGLDFQVRELDESVDGLRLIKTDEVVCDASIICVGGLLGLFLTCSYRNGAVLSID